MIFGHVMLLASVLASHDANAIIDCATIRCKMTFFIMCSIGIINGTIEFLRSRQSK